jgi:hypothetical protein
MQMEFVTKRRAAESTGLPVPTRGGPASVFLSMTWLAASGLMVGCSGGGMPASSGNSTPAVTKVTVVLTSDATDQFTQYDAVLQSITLTNSSGKSVALLSQSLGTEFVHINSLVEPAITGTVPQDTYTSATVNIGAAQFTCLTINAEGGVQDSTFAYGYVPASNVSVSLPAPVVVAGASTGLTLRMLVQQSANLSSCAAGATYSITPSFALSAFDIAAAPSGSASNTVLSLEGAVTSVNSSSSNFEIQRAAFMSQPATTLTVSIDGDTAIQGISSLTSLAVGMFVDLDGAIQVDGSVHATRVSVADPTAVDVRRGPIVSVDQSNSVVTIEPIEGQGKDGIASTEPYELSDTSFRISSQLSNVQTLPFAASFNAANMVPGQNVYTSSPAFVTCCGALFFAPATTVTLMPQTIDGLVFGSSVSGKFTIYSVQLSANDPFVSLATQTGLPTRLTQPDQVQVYVDAGTRLLNSNPVVVGGTLRFYGLVFNDQGVLRMDCAQINDGVF